MNNKDKEFKNICSINFKETGYVLQKVRNKVGDDMYVIIDSNNPTSELYSCYELDLGNMLQNLILSEEVE
jgi:hypothetical protein